MEVAVTKWYHQVLATHNSKNSPVRSPRPAIAKFQLIAQLNSSYPVPTRLAKHVGPKGSNGP